MAERLGASEPPVAGPQHDLQQLIAALTLVTTTEYPPACCRVTFVSWSV
jgi:hypothetical protein